MSILKNFYIKYKYQLINLLAHATFIAYSLLFPYYFLITILLGWVINNLFHSLYMHRIFTHKHFEVAPIIHRIGLFFFTSMNLGSPPVYAAVHLKHHVNSGTEKDPHNHYSLGFLKTLLSLWDEKFIPDRKFLAMYLKDDLTKWFHKYHLTIATSSALITPFIIVTSFWLSKIVVILVHIDTLGYGVNNGNDTSKNVWWLKPISWGEELHNNHHYFAGKANHNLKNNWKEFDLLYCIGKLFSKK